MGNTYGLVLEDVCSVLDDTCFEVIDVLLVLDYQTNEAQQIEDAILDGMMLRCPLCKLWLRNITDNRDSNRYVWNQTKGCCVKCAKILDKLFR